MSTHPYRSGRSEASSTRRKDVRTKKPTKSTMLRKERWRQEAWNSALIVLCAASRATIRVSRKSRMKFRHATPLARWVSRILAAILLAIPIAWQMHVFDVRCLNSIDADSKSFLLYQQKIHSHSMSLNVSALSVFGSVYIGLVEGLGGVFARFYSAKIRH